MNLKLEEFALDRTPIYIKYEGLKTEEPSSFSIKNEEIILNFNHEYTLQYNSSIAIQNNQRFSQLLLSLEHYLENFVVVEDFIVDSATCSAKETEEIISESKKLFKEWGIKIVRTLGENLKKKAVQHILPDSYLIQMVETTKRRIFNSFKQLKKNIAEALADDNRDKVSVKEEASIPKKRIIKKKSDFPDHARSLLKAWFLAHINDPYPSHEEKIYLAKEGGITMRQIENWLTNTRGRVWKKKQQGPKFDLEIQKIFFSCKDEELH